MSALEKTYEEWKVEVLRANALGTIDAYARAREAYEHYLTEYWKEHKG